MRQSEFPLRVAHVNRSQDQEGLVILEAGILQDEKPRAKGVYSEGAAYYPAIGSFNRQGVSN